MRTTEESDCIARTILRKEHLIHVFPLTAYRSEPGLLLFFVWRTAYLSLIPFHAYPTYFATYFMAYFTSSRPSSKSKCLFVLILLIRAYLCLFALNKQDRRSLMCFQMAVIVHLDNICTRLTRIGVENGGSTFLLLRREQPQQAGSRHARPLFCRDDGFQTATNRPFRPLFPVVSRLQRQRNLRHPFPNNSRDYARQTAPLLTSQSRC